MVRRTSAWPVWMKNVLNGLPSPCGPACQHPCMKPWSRLIREKYSLRRPPPLRYGSGPAVAAIKQVSVTLNASERLSRWVSALLQCKLHTVTSASPAAAVLQINMILAGSAVLQSSPARPWQAKKPASQRAPGQSLQRVFSPQAQAGNLLWSMVTLPLSCSVMAPTSMADSSWSAVIVVD